MPVVINDFEIIVDTPEPSGAPGAAAEALPGAPPPTTPEGIAATERHQRRRAARIRAH
jgi:hypothetical protein